jgi:hypothetical protein
MAENTLPVLQRLAAAEAAGAPVREPVRWRQAQALANRLAGQPPAVQRVLAARLARVLDAMDAASVPAAPATERPGLQALVALNQQLRAPAESAQPVIGVSTPLAPPAGRTELKSIARFRGTWARLRAEAQVRAAESRAPANAGPLNPHMLVLNALSQLRHTSPDYLRHFLAQVESLSWLERAMQPPRAPAAKARAPRSAKPRG